MKLQFMLIFLSLGLSCIYAAPVEVGNVDWRRDHDAVLAESSKTGKPVFALFQEVPGCAECQKFGREVLSDPALVEVIESAFIPLLIYNNRDSDRELLKCYKEPAWNFQVVRFLDGKGHDIIPREDRAWTLPALKERMIEALQKADRELPAEWAEVNLKEAAIAQYCFWTGERVIGAVDGVVETEAGFMDGREVTRFRYDPSVVSLKAIEAAARQANAAEQVYTSLEGYRKAPESDQKRQLRGLVEKDLSLSPYQATKLNAWIRTEPQKARALLNQVQK